MVQPQLPQVQPAAKEDLYLLCLHQVLHTAEGTHWELMQQIKSLL